MGCGWLSLQPYSSVSTKPAQAPRASMRTGFEDYEIFQANAIQNIETSKFLVYTTNPYAGLGNRMIGLLSAFMLAFVTDRAFIVCWDHSNEIKKHPSQEKFIMLKFSELFDEVPIDIACRNDLKFDLVLSDDELFTLQTVRFFDFNKQFPQRVIQVRFILDIRELILQNPLYRNDLISRFGERVTNEFSTYIFRPSDSVARVIFEVRSERARENVLGVHIRRPPLETSIDRSKWTTRREIETFKKCAKANFADHTIFLATDSSSVRQEFDTIFSGSLHTSAADMMDEVRSTRAGILSAVADIFLLGGAHSLMMFGRSSFSQTASSLRVDNVFSVDGFECRRYHCQFPFSESRSAVTRYRGSQWYKEQGSCVSAVEIPGSNIAILLFANVLSGFSPCNVENFIHSSENAFLTQHKVSYIVITDFAVNFRAGSPAIRVIRTFQSSALVAYLEALDLLSSFDSIFVASPDILFTSEVLEHVLLNQTVFLEPAFGWAPIFFGGTQRVIRHLLIELSAFQRPEDPAVQTIGHVLSKLEAPKAVILRRSTSPCATACLHISQQEPGCDVAPVKVSSATRHGVAVVLSALQYSTESAASLTRLIAELHVFFNPLLDVYFFAFVHSSVHCSCPLRSVRCSVVVLSNRGTFAEVLLETFSRFLRFEFIFFIPFSNTIIMAPIEEMILNQRVAVRAANSSQFLYSDAFFGGHVHEVGKLLKIIQKTHHVATSISLWNPTLVLDPSYAWTEPHGVPFHSEIKLLVSSAK